MLRAHPVWHSVAQCGRLLVCFLNFGAVGRHEVAFGQGRAAVLVASQGPVCVHNLGTGWGCLTHALHDVSIRYRKTNLSSEQICKSRGLSFGTTSVLNRIGI
jgi:hypothetical protein